jgi:uncharacterized membrane protein HdeD (DUF308 family)
MSIPSDEAVGGRWKWFVGFGIVIAIFGLIALWNVVDATLVTTVILGFVMLLAGITQIIGAFASGGSMGGRVLLGILGLLFAIVGYNIMADPLRGAIALTVVVAIALIVDGIVRLFGAISGRTEHRGITSVVAVINILLGFWLWSGIPMTGIAIGFFVGLQLLMAGFLWIAIGWMGRSQTKAAASRSAV